MLTIRASRLPMAMACPASLVDDGSGTSFVCPLFEY